MDDSLIPLASGETIAFACTPDVACFNECCRDLNQYLTPYDIIRLKHCLGLPSGVFLERYTTGHDGPRTGLPVVSLKPLGGREKICPFVTPDGCSVYEARPSSCRTYPLVRAVSRSRDTGRQTAHYALIREAHCCGHSAPRSWTVGQWIADQGLDAYHDVNDMFLPVISAKNRHHPGPLDLRAKRLFHLAMYDLDAFRAQMKRPGFLGMHPPDSGTLRRMAEDDVALLKFSHVWIRQTLFGRPGV